VWNESLKRLAALKIVNEIIKEDFDTMILGLKGVLNIFYLFHSWLKINLLNMS
jgi:hypothetical protein